MAASTWSTTDKNASLTLSGSNLIATAAAVNVGVRGKDPKRTGKYYIEYTSTTTQGGGSLYGFATARSPLGTNSAVAQSFFVTNGGGNTAFDSFGISITGLGLQSGTVTTGTVLCAAIDLDAGFVWFRIGAAGIWNNNAANNPATSVGGLPLVGTGLGQGIDVYPFLSFGVSGNSITANFGASAFSGAVPAGFTSGWDDSVSIVTNAVASQVALEEWGAATSAAQATSVFLEQWAAVSTVNPQVVVTTMLAEMWASVAQSGGATQAVRAMVLA